MVQRASHVQLAVGHAVGAAVGVLILGALVDHIAAGCTVIHLIGGDQAGIQRRGRCDQLEHRTGIVQLGDVFVFPLGFPQHALQDGVLVIVNETVHQIFLGLGLAKPVFQRGGGSGVQQAVFQNVAQLGVVDGVRFVGVKLLHGGHGQNRAGFHIHHDGTAAVLDIKVLHRFGKVLFHHGLNVLVNGQVQAAAVDGLVNFRIRPGQHLAAHVGLGNGAARRARQHLIVGFFQAVKAVSVRVAEAQHRGQKRPVGVGACGGLLGGKVQNALAGLPFRGGQTVAAGPFQNGVRHRFFHALGKHLVLVQLVLGIAVGHFGVQAVGGGAVIQNGGNLLAGVLQLGIGDARLAGLGGVRDDVPHRVAFCQQLAGGGIDGAAGGGQRLVADLLLHRLGAVNVGVPQLEGVQLVNQQPAAENQEHRHRDGGAQACAVVGAGRLAMVWFSCHGQVP